MQLYFQQTPEKPEPEKENVKDEKSSPFGPRMLKKTTPKSAEKEVINNNANNNATSPTSTNPPASNRWKSKSLEKS